MTSNKKTQEEKVDSAPFLQQNERKSGPEWTDGLRQLYDSVVEEPIPDSFMDLLSKLDADDESGG